MARARLRVTDLLPDGPPARQPKNAGPEWPGDSARGSCAAVGGERQGKSAPRSGREKTSAWSPAPTPGCSRCGALSHGNAQALPWAEIWWPLRATRNTASDGARVHAYSMQVRMSEPKTAIRNLHFVSVQTADGMFQDRARGLLHRAASSRAMVLRVISSCEMSMGFVR